MPSRFQRFVSRVDSRCDRRSRTDSVLLYRYIMAFLLDLPPELINLIIMHLQDTDEPSDPEIPVVRERPFMMGGVPLLCSCYDEENMVDQLWTQDGPESRKVQRNVIRFGTAHPYIADCIAKSRRCEMVDVWVTANRPSGLIVMPSIRAALPSTVR
jgi:hypothetical protein